MERTQPLPLEDEIESLHRERTRYECAAQLARNTQVGYGYDWAMFTAFCVGLSRSPLPASTETVQLYLTFLLREGKKVSTAKRRTCAIAHYHRAAGFVSPVTREVYQLLDGAQRLRAEKPRQMRPLAVAELRDISRRLATIRTDAGIRNRALLVVGFASALRRSNLAALTLSDVTFCDQGVLLSVSREKQDQRGRGRLIAVPAGQDRNTDPVRLLRLWRGRRGVQPGPLFLRGDHKHRGEQMDGECVIRIVKKSVALIGLEPAHYGAHSLRAGFITAAGEANVGHLLIAAHSGH